jgi:alkylated DNA repair dioxygenase AlkB
MANIENSQPALFEPSKSQFHLDPGTFTLHPDFLGAQLASHLFETLSGQLQWEQSTIRMFGKTIQIPRLQVWMGDKEAHYRYSGSDFKPAPWHEQIYQLKTKISARTGHVFNSVLCNLYRDENDSVAWHADDEPELGPTPVIASYSLGASRPFELQLKDKEGRLRRKPVKIDLPHDSLLVMHEGIQTDWQHRIAKLKRPTAPRINLTFRHILSNKRG